jgi:RNA polymerase sigma-70 factor (ECF subfamily)
MRDWSDDASWREFFATYSRLIYSMALKAGITDTEAEDLVPGTMMGVPDAIRDFQYDREVGSFKQRIGNHAAWRIQDPLRRSQRDLARDRESSGTATRDRTVHRMPDDRDNVELFFERDWNEAVVASLSSKTKKMTI